METLSRQERSAITLLDYGYFRIYQDRQTHQQSAQSPIYPQDHGTMVQWKSNHRNNDRWKMVSAGYEQKLGAINVPVESHSRITFTFTK